MFGKQSDDQKLKEGARFPIMEFVAVTVLMLLATAWLGVWATFIFAVGLLFVLLNWSARVTKRFEQLSKRIRELEKSDKQ